MYKLTSGQEVSFRVGPSQNYSIFTGHQLSMVRDVVPGMIFLFCVVFHAAFYNFSVISWRFMCKLQVLLVHLSWHQRLCRNAYHWVPSHVMDVNDWDHNFYQIQYANKIVQVLLTELRMQTSEKVKQVKQYPLILGNQIKLLVSECVNIIFKCNKG